MDEKKPPTPPAKIGKLEDVDLRSIWRHEAANFTRWLTKNIDHLSEVLGFEIIVHKIEEDVGPYHVDIYGEDDTGNKLIIEKRCSRNGERRTRIDRWSRAQTGIGRPNLYEKRNGLSKALVRRSKQQKRNFAWTTVERRKID
jgi:hypothetical protein